MTQGETAVTQGKTAVTQGETAVTQGETAVTQGETAVTQGETAHSIVLVDGDGLVLIVCNDESMVEVFVSHLVLFFVRRSIIVQYKP